MTRRSVFLAVAFVSFTTAAATAQFPRPKPIITSVEPHSGKEGTIVTIKGRNFPLDPKNNCFVFGGMAAFGTVEPKPTATEIKVRIGPVAKKSTGDVLMWPGTAFDVHMTDLSFRSTTLEFTRTKLFRNGSPVTSAGVEFELTEVSPNTYTGYFQEKLLPGADLGGLERVGAVRIVFPRDLKVEEGTVVDVVVMLKEPTLAIGFSAEVSGKQTAEDVLQLIAKSLSADAMSIGESISTDVVRNDKTGEWELYVSKPLLEAGIGTVRFRDKMSKTEGEIW